MSVSSPFSESHCFICCTEFGFSSEVSSCIFVESSAFDRSSNRIAFSTTAISRAIPRSFICWSRAYSSQTKSGTENLRSLSCIDISTSTSRLLYALKSDHFSGACSGRFLVLPPFVLVAAQGTQKYLMRSLPSFSFCSDKPRTAPAPASDNGSPIYADHTIEHLHEVGSRYSPDGKPRYIDRHTRSKAALKAHLIMLLSVSAARISLEIFSPCARSYTTTSPPFTETPNSSISNAGDSTYLYTPHFARSTSLNVSMSIDSVLILSIVHLKKGGKVFLPPY